MNNDWKEDANPADALKPGAERNITGDISIIKPDRENYTDDELRQFAQKIGAKFEDVQEFVEGQDGVMVPASDDDEDGEDGGEDADGGYGMAANGTGEQTDEADTYDPFNQ
jgi:hypothetical protein